MYLSMTCHSLMIKTKATRHIFIKHITKSKTNGKIISVSKKAIKASICR